VDNICKITTAPEPENKNLPPLSKFKRIEVAREWKSFGSEHDIKMESVSNLSELTSVKISRKKGEFKGAYKFGDRDSVDGFLELRPYRDSNPELLRSELNVAIQAVPELNTVSAQTSWFRPLNFQCQYKPITMDAEEQEEHLESEAMESFLRNISVYFVCNCR
jgi:hypothetical protein